MEGARGSPEPFGGCLETGWFSWSHHGSGINERMLEEVDTLLAQSPAGDVKAKDVLHKTCIESLLDSIHTKRMLVQYAWLLLYLT